MAFEMKTIDEETNELVDSYDKMIAPYKVHRNNNNKLFLILRSIGTGFSKIRDIVMSLKYRFDPRFCADDDLESAMFITGETRIDGKASLLRMSVLNTDPTEAVTLEAGEYLYTSAQGQEFYMVADKDLAIDPLGYAVVLFSSRDIGAHEVAGESSASVTRKDGAIIPEAFDFESYENSSSLGRLPETNFEIRERLIHDTKRQDSLRELELALKALPNIFECNLIFNGSNTDKVALEDGTVLEPKELLIVATGVVDDEFAATVASKTFYKTHESSEMSVVYYKNDLLVGGEYPIYYMAHKKKQFYLTIHYTFNRNTMQEQAVNAGFERLLRKYRFMTEHIDVINEPLLYGDLANLGMPDVSLNKVYIQEMAGASLQSVSEVKIPKLMLPELVDITYIAEEA